jgi:hypothetical protein
MAEATFTLRAVDSTRAAFASVQNSLTKIHSTAKAVSTGIASFFGLRALLSVGSSVNRMMEDVEANSQKFGLTTDELNRLTRVTGTVDKGVAFLKKGVVFAADAVLNLKDQLFGVSAVNSISIADKIRADVDAPKIAEATKQLQKIKETIDLIGATPMQNFKVIGDKISALNNKPLDPSKSSALSALEKEAELQDLIYQRALIANSAREKMVDSVIKGNEANKDYVFSLLSENEQQKILSNRMSELVVQMAKLDALIPVNQINALVTPEELANMEKLTMLSDEYTKLLGKRKVMETDLQIIARNAGSMIASGFEDAIFSGQKLGEVIRSLGMDLMRMVFQQTVTAPLAAGISGAILKGFGARAMGGPVSAGSPYVVGEKGPELFVPSSSGSIVPNGAMGSSGGSAGGVTVNYNIAAGVSRAELVPILEQERRRLKAEIPDMVRRGGSYRAAFA